MQVILRHRSKDHWSGVVKYKNCFSTIASYLTRSGLKYTGLTREDEARFEKALSYPEGYLGKNSKFWDTFAIKLGNKDYILNTEVPYEEMVYIYLKNHKDVMNGLNDIKPSAKYVLINKESEAKEVNTFNRVKREAYREFDKLSLEDMRKVLRLYGFKSDTISAELVESKLTDEIEKDPNKFLNKWVNNKNRETETIIQTAISKNIIRKNKNVFYYGTDIIGNSMDDTIAYLDNKSNQDIKLSIINEIENK